MIKTMNQIQILKKMTGEQRLNQALLLSDFTRQLALINIKQNLGTKTTGKRIQEELRKRLWET